MRVKPDSRKSVRTGAVKTPQKNSPRQSVERRMTVVHQQNTVKIKQNLIFTNELTIKEIRSSAYLAQKIAMVTINQFRLHSRIFDRILFVLFSLTRTKKMNAPPVTEVAREQWCSLTIEMQFSPSIMHF